MLNTKSVFVLILLFAVSYQQYTVIHDLYATDLTNFTNQTANWTWSGTYGTTNNQITTCNGSYLLGGYAISGKNAKVYKTYSNLATHNQVDFRVKIWYMDSWTNQMVIIEVDSTAIITSTVAASSWTTQTNWCGGSGVDGYLPYYATLAHDASTITIEFISTLNQVSTTHSWGISELTLVFTTVTTPDSTICTTSTNGNVNIDACTCAEGQYNSSTLGCTTCADQCSSCYGGDRSSCYTCNSLYTLRTDNTCGCDLYQGLMLGTAGYCSSCYYSNCKTCNDNIYTCSLCRDGCTSCYSNNLYCTQCNSTMVLYNAQCYTTCPSYSYNITGSCATCPTGCPSCANSTYCNTCDSSSTMVSDGQCNCTSSGYYTITSGCDGYCGLGCSSCTNSSVCLSCYAGYYDNGANSCSACMTGCNDCTNSSICLGCNSAYGYLEDDKCVCTLAGYYTTTSGCDSACMTGCSSCTNGTVCITCQTGYYNLNGVCYQCLPGCYSCTSDSACTSCYSGTTLSNGYCMCNTGGYYSPSNYSLCTSTCATNCNSCYNSSLCLSCVATYYPSGSGCSDCSPDCQTCSDSSTCSACGSSTYLSNGLCLCNTQGLYSSSHSSICDSTCSGSCITCSNSTVCIACASGYYLSGGVCVQCAPDCLACTGPSSCTSCGSSTSLSNGYCICNSVGVYSSSVSSLCDTTCGTGCNTCTNSSLCISCATTYYNNGASCSSCGFDCSTCTNSTSCNTCGSSSYLASSGSCLCNTNGYFSSSTVCDSMCSTGCTNCTSSSACQVCSSGYYLNDQSCTQCSFGCNSCNSAGCTTCNSSYTYLSNGICLCNTAGLFSSSASSLCDTSCTTGCISCSNSSQCITCNTGYYLNDGLCVECGADCLSCTSSGCTSCGSSSFLSNGVCMCNSLGKYSSSNSSICLDSCMTGCNNCTNSTVCISCTTGYYNDGGVCTACGTDCLSCTNSTTCNTCDSSTTLINGTCICNNAGNYTTGLTNGICDTVCPTGCNNCSSAATCYSCSTNYYLSGTTCLPCGLDCTQCTSTGCQTCNSNTTVYSGTCLCNSAGFYTAVSGYSCNATCPTGCTNCTSADNCISCKTGYFLSNGVCSPCGLDCLTCSNSTNCTTCNSATHLYSGSCLCNSYGKYSPSNTSTCTGTCPTGCTNCTSASTCVTCQSGYYLASDGLCKPCGPDCKTCIDNTTCTTCGSSTYLSNGLCLCNTAGAYSPSRDSVCTGTCSYGCSVCSNSTSCITCGTGTTLSSSGACMCATNGTYYIQGSGCSGTCLNNCQYCLNAQSCLSCSSATILQDGICGCASPKILVNNECQCPTNYVANGTGCMVNGFLYIIKRPQMSAYTDLYLQAIINPSDDATAAPNIIWNATCNTDDATQASISAALAAQVTKILRIPAAYLTAGLSCTVQGSYTSPAGMLNQNTTTITISSSTITPHIQTVGPYLQTLAHSEANTIVAQLAPMSYLSSLSSLTVAWTQTAGTSISVSSLTSSSNPLWLTIPKCTLKMGNVYKIQTSVSLLGSTTWTTETAITTPRPSPKVAISSSNRVQLASSDLSLSATVTVDDPCNVLSLSDVVTTSSIKYTWLCSIIKSSTSKTTCTDTYGLFNNPRSTSTLTVPSSYLTAAAGYELNITVQITASASSSTSNQGIPLPASANVFSDSTSSSYAIVSSGSSLSITCTSNNDCQTFLELFATNLVTSESTSDYYSTYTWSFSYNIPVYTFYNYLKIYPNLVSTNFGSNPNPFLRISLAISGTTNAQLYFELPINRGPQNGSVYTYPSSVQALSTSLYIITRGWIDSEIPLTYQFQYGLSQDANYVPITTKQYDPYAFFELIALPSNSTVYIKANVFNSIGANNSVITAISVTNTPTDISSALTLAETALSAMSRDHPYQIFSRSAMILENLDYWVGLKIPSTCSDCSGNGQCNTTSGTCTCNSGFTLADCSMTTSVATRIITAKTTAVSNINSIYTSMSNNTDMRETFFRSVSIASNISNLNQDSNWATYNSILQNVIQVSNITMTLREIQYFVTIVNNLFAYAGDVNANAFSVDTLVLYLNAMGKSSLNNQLPDEPAVIYVTKNFDLFSQRTTIAHLGTLNLTTSSDAPSIVLTPKSTSFTASDYITRIDVLYYVFNGNIFSSTKTSSSSSSGSRLLSEGPSRMLATDNSKSFIALDVKKSGSTDSVGNIQAAITMPPGVACPSGTYTASNGKCIADDIGAFDVSKQLAKIFSESKITQVANVAALVGWKFYASVAFWAVFVFSMWFLASIRWVIKKYSTYDILHKYQPLPNDGRIKTWLRKMFTLMLTTHPMLSIYFHKDEKMNKITRLVLYYTRNVLVLTYSTIFSGLDDGASFTFKVYLVIFNFILIAPISFIFEIITEHGLNHKKGTSPRMKKFKVIASMSFIGGCLLGLLLIIFILSAQNSSSEQISWTVNFVINIIQDIIFSPMIGLASQIFLLRASGSNWVGEVAFLSLIVGKLTSKKVKKFYGTIFNGEQNGEAASNEVPANNPQLDQSVVKSYRKRSVGDIKEDSDNKNWISKNNIFHDNQMMDDDNKKREIISVLEFEFGDKTQGNQFSESPELPLKKKNMLSFTNSNDSSVIMHKHLYSGVDTPAMKGLKAAFDSDNYDEDHLGDIDMSPQAIRSPQVKANQQRLYAGNEYTPSSFSPFGLRSPTMARQDFSSALGRKNLVSEENLDVPGANSSQPFDEATLNEDQDDTNKSKHIEARENQDEQHKLAVNLNDIYNAQDYHPDDYRSARSQGFDHEDEKSSQRHKVGLRTKTKSNHFTDHNNESNDN